MTDSTYLHPQKTLENEAAMNCPVDVIQKNKKYKRKEEFSITNM